MKRIIKNSILFLSLIMLVSWQLFFAIPLQAANGDINTIAGGYTGDGGSATLAPITNQNQVLSNADGSYYVVQTDFDRVSYVNSSGNISTIAGGITGFSGDGSQATTAKFDHPAGISKDSQGNLYLADTNNARIRKISSSGVVSTFAGGGFLALPLGNPAPATLIQLGTPVDVKASGSSVYFIDGFVMIRRVDSNGIARVVAGNGSFGDTPDGSRATSGPLSNIFGLAVDAQGNIFFSQDNRIRKVSTTGILSTIAGTSNSGYSGDGGSPTSALLNGPTSLSFDSSGNLYFVDRLNSVVRKISTSNIISTVAGNGSGGNGTDNVQATSTSISPTSVSVNASGTMFIGVDAAVKKVDAAGIISTVAGVRERSGSGSFYPCAYSGDNGPAVGAGLCAPFKIAKAPDGSLYIADTESSEIRKISSQGTISSVYGQISPTYVAVDSSGNIYWPSGNSRIIKMNTSGTVSDFAGNSGNGFSGDGGPATQATLSGVSGVAADSSGNVYLIDSNRIRKVDLSGVITTVAGSGASGYTGDGGSALSATFNSPRGIAIDNTGNILIADQNNNAVREINTSGIIRTVAGNGVLGFAGDGGQAVAANLEAPYDVCFGLNGSFYVVDGSNRVRQINTSGVINTVAGSLNLDAGFSGDNAPATSARLNNPLGIAVAPEGLYIADTNNNRIRLVSGSF